MLYPKVINDVFLAFPANVLGTHLPYIEWYSNHKFAEEWVDSPWGELATSIFIGDFPNLTISFKENIDQNLFVRHIKACLGSFQPSSEQKIGGVGFLLALWCDINWPDEQKEQADALQKLAMEKAANLQWEQDR